MSSRAERRLERERMKSETINKAIDVIKGAVEGISKIPVAPLFAGYIGARIYGILHAKWVAAETFSSISPEGKAILKSDITKVVLDEEAKFAGTVNNIALSLAVAGAIGGGAQIIGGIAGAVKGT